MNEVDRLSRILGAWCAVFYRCTDGDVKFARLVFGLIVMNPPYSLALPFVAAALEVVRSQAGTVAALLRLGFLASRKRRDWWQSHPADVYVLSERPSFTGDGRTDATDYAWFVWREGAGRVRVL